MKVVLEEDETVEYGADIAKKLLEKLGVSESDLVTGSYLDRLSK